MWIWMIIWCEVASFEESETHKKKTIYITQSYNCTNYSVCVCVTVWNVIFRSTDWRGDNHQNHNTNNTSNLCIMFIHKNYTCRSSESSLLYLNFNFRYFNMDYRGCFHLMASRLGRIIWPNVHFIFLLSVWFGMENYIASNVWIIFAVLCDEMYHSNR